MGLGLQEPSSSHHHATDPVLAEQVHDWYVSYVGRVDASGKLQPWAREFNDRSDVTVATNRRLPFLNLQNGNWTFFKASEGMLFYRDAAGRALGLARADLRHSARLANGLADQTTLQTTLGQAPGTLPASGYNRALRLWTERQLFDRIPSVSERPALLAPQTARAHPVNAVAWDGMGRQTVRVEPRFNLSGPATALQATTFGRFELWGSHQRFNFLVFPASDKRPRCQRPAVDLRGAFRHAQMARVASVAASFYEPVSNNILPIETLVTGEAEEQRWTSNFGPSLNMFVGMFFVRLFKSAREGIVWQTAIEQPDRRKQAAIEVSDKPDRRRQTQLVYTSSSVRGFFWEAFNSFQGNDPNNYLARSSLPYVARQSEVVSRSAARLATPHKGVDARGEAFDLLRMAITKAQVAEHHRLLAALSAEPRAGEFWREEALDWQSLREEAVGGAATLFAAYGGLERLEFSLAATSQSASDHFPPFVNRALHLLDLPAAKQEDSFKLQLLPVVCPPDNNDTKTVSSLQAGGTPASSTARERGLFSMLRDWLHALLQKLGLARVNFQPDGVSFDAIRSTQRVAIDKATASTSHMSTVPATVAGNVFIESAVEMSGMSPSRGLTDPGSKVALTVGLRVDQKTEGQADNARDIQRRLAHALDQLLGSQFSALCAQFSGRATPQTRSVMAEYRWSSLVELQVDLAHGLRPEDDGGLPQHWRGNAYGIEFAAILRLRQACDEARRFPDLQANGRRCFDAHLEFTRALNAFLSDVDAVDLRYASSRTRAACSDLDSRTSKRALLLAGFVDIAETGRQSRLDYRREIPLRPQYSTQAPRAAESSKVHMWQLARDTNELSRTPHAAVTPPLLYRFCLKIVDAINRIESDLTLLQQESSSLDQLNHRLPRQTVERRVSERDWLDNTMYEMRSTTERSIEFLLDLLDRGTSSATTRAGQSTLQFLDMLTRSGASTELEALVRLSCILRRDHSRPLPLSRSASQLDDFSLAALSKRVEFQVNQIANDCLRRGSCVGEIRPLRRWEQQLPLRSLEVLTDGLRLASATNLPNDLLVRKRVTAEGGFRALDAIANGWTAQPKREGFPLEVHPQAQRRLREAAWRYLRLRGVKDGSEHA